MSKPEFTMRQLLEAGVHFGHQTHRWNPKMAPYIFGARSNIHILDLSQTIPLLHQALKEVRDVAAKGGRVLFVGTKRTASEPVAYAAKRCAQYYVNHRWLGGMLTNWPTVTKSISRLKELEDILGGSVDIATGMTKKETLKLTREMEKLEKALGGIKDMGGKPDLMFVIDTNRESIAIMEARRLGIPVVAVLDSNSDPSSADLPIPGNDDAGRAIQLYCELMADAVLDGMKAAAAAVGQDFGAYENPEELALNFAPAAKVVTSLAKEQAAVEAVSTTDGDSEFLAVTREYDPDAKNDTVVEIERYLGASLKNKDAKYVACSDETELETIVKGFMKKKLGITDAAVAMEKVRAVCEKMKPTRMKNRVTFYYLLAKNENMLNAFTTNRYEPASNLGIFLDSQKSESHQVDPHSFIPKDSPIITAQNKGLQLITPLNTIDKYIIVQKSICINNTCFANLRDTRNNCFFEANWIEENFQETLHFRWEFKNNPLDLLEKVGRALIISKYFSNLTFELFLNDSILTFNEVDYDFLNYEFTKKLLGYKGIQIDASSLGLRLFSFEQENTFDLMIVTSVERPNIIFSKTYNEKSPIIINEVNKALLAHNSILN